jgi:hypothetical protein
MLARPWRFGRSIFMALRVGTYITLFLYTAGMSTWLIAGVMLLSSTLVWNPLWILGDWDWMSDFVGRARGFATA